MTEEQKRRTKNERAWHKTLMGVSSSVWMSERPNEVTSSIKRNNLIDINYLLREIEKLKTTYYEQVKLDNKLKIDPYENVARLKVCERIEKIVKKMKGAE